MDFIGNNLNNIINQNNNENNNLKNELSKTHKIIEEQKSIINALQNKLNNLNNTINNYKTEIKNLKKIIFQNNSELNNLRNQLKNKNPNNLPNKVDFNEIVVVNFISMDQNVHYAVAAVKNNTFAEIEEKLYKKYPQYRATNNNFLANGAPILRFKTIAENKIDNGLPVTLIVPY